MSKRTLVLGSALIALLVAGAFVGIVIATSGDDDDLVVFSARSHYGEEKPFETFDARQDISTRIFGGDAPELYERLRSESDETDADVLVTVDAANLWRAEQAGLLRPVRSPALERSVPAELRDPRGRWYGLTVRARTIMRSVDRVASGAVTTYAGLGDPRWKGRLCLRSGTSDYNISFVADRIAKDGEPATRRMLERWMANDPTILGSDVDVLNAIAKGDCDLGLTNSYYLGRELEEDPDFPVAPIWADQQGRGTHVNLSGIAVVAATDKPRLARQLIDHLGSSEQQQVLAANNHEFAVDPGVEPTDEIAQFGRFKRDPIDVAGAGSHLGDAVRLMNQVGWN
ncbi:MAG TPA: extracellular solute-binding protein [Thermoleophilaceae bacterium]|nr:extracellular solute-binding protein [Thermoleophilaceae bacterium]